MIDENVEESMNKILKTIDRWEESKDRPTALQLQLQLSIMKLIIGNDNFDGLPAFSRILKDVTEWISRDDKLKADFNKAAKEIPESINAMIQSC